MKGVGMTEPAVFLELQFIRCLLFILCCVIIPLLALRACKSNNISHLRLSLVRQDTLYLYLKEMPRYSITSLITPAPTVRPPSRIANRNSFSIAIGMINSIAMLTLSPGITISTPSGNVTTPVTSVVRK